MAWTQDSDPVNANTQAADVTNANDWVGNCSSLDIFNIIEPEEPTDFTDVSTANTDILILEGFELDSDYVDGTQEDLFDLTSILGAPFSISSTNRGSTITGGQSLKATITTTNHGFLRFNIKLSNPPYAYYRAYVKFDTLTNTNGSDRSVELFGWTDSTGDRSWAFLRFKAGGTIVWGVAQGAGIGTSTDSVVAPSTGVWYRCELVTELLTSSASSTLYVYLGDTTTLVTSVTVTGGGGSITGGFPFVGTEIATQTGNAITYYIDDIRIQTGSPTIISTSRLGPLMGPGGIWPMIPSADFSTQWTPLSGSNFESVNEFPLTNDAETSYITSSGASQVRDLYEVTYSPNTVPVAKFIKVVHARASVRRVSGSGSPSHSILYMSPLDTVFAGPAQVLANAAYFAYPWNDASISLAVPSIFLKYAEGLPTEFKSEHKIGIQRNTGSATAVSRATMVWGYVEVAASV